MITSVPDAVIRYTLDGSEPTNTSEIYLNPFRLKKPTTIRAKAFYLDTESYTTWWVQGESETKKSGSAVYSGATY